MATIKKSPAKKKPAKKAIAKKPVPKKAAAKKVTPKKAPVKKAPKKTAVKKTAPKKTAAKKATPKKPVSKKTVKKSVKPKTIEKKAVKVKGTAKKAVSQKKTTAPKVTPKSAPKSTKQKTKPTENKEEKVKVSNQVQTAKAKPKKEAAPKIAVARRPVRRMPTRKKGVNNDSFHIQDLVVYPAHGVGRIVTREKQTIADMEIELFVINFEHEKMKLRVPVHRAADSGMRPLSSDAEVDGAIELLQGRARVKRTMWSRRAQEYEAKINSGDMRAVAEVVRDLYRSPEQPDQSYSERQLYESAVDRMAREVSAVRKVDQPDAVLEMEASLQKKQIAA